MNEPQQRIDVRCAGCFQYRLTQRYRGLYLCTKRCWRKRKTIHGLDLHQRKKAVRA